MIDLFKLAAEQELLAPSQTQKIVVVRIQRGNVK